MHPPVFVRVSQDQSVGAARTSGFHHEPYPSGGTVVPDTGPMKRDPAIPAAVGTLAIGVEWPQGAAPGVTPSRHTGPPRVSRRRVPT